MEANILNEIKKDEKLHEYLKNNSIWYIYLNRDSKNLDKLKVEFKNYKKEMTINKVDKTINNIELLSNIIKIV